jgi:parallel beta-helix repeat protein
LGVPWASDFVSIAANEINVKTDSRLKVKALGDGATDDAPAIRAAIQLASSSGGGVVYFPTGDYKIITASNSVRGNPLVMPSRVILRGASSSTSRIFMNDPSSTAGTEGTWTWGGIDFYGSSLSGMTDLSVTAVTGASSSSPCATIWNQGSTGVSELFFNNMNIELNNCRPFWFNGVNNLLLKNSKIDSIEDNPRADQVGPIYIVGNTNVSVIGNTITYRFGRVQLWNNANVLMQGNTLIRDAQLRDMQNGTAIESGGVQLSFDSNVQVLNNTIQTVNAPSDEADDGEAIMSQLGSTANIIDAGTSTAITSTSLTDTNALWGSVTVSRLAKYPNTVVAILSGSATGEVRTIQSFATSTKTLAVTQPWNPVPEVGSLYSIFSWTLKDATIEGNTLIGNPNGIELYDGCYNCTVQNNILTDSRGIRLRTVDTRVSQTTYPETRRIHEVAINNRILNNTVSNISGIRPAYIALDAEGFAKDTYRGMGIMNVRVESNVVNPYSRNPDGSYVSGASELTQEGLFPCFLYGPASFKDPLTTVFQKINYWNNTLSTPVTHRPDFLPFASPACVTSSTPPAANTP